MPWWSWVLVGLGLLVVETVSSAGLFGLFFGFSALVVAAAEAAGVAGPAWAQWILFAVVGAAATAALRARVKRRLATPDARVDRIVGEVAVALEDLPPRGFGRAELRGSPWQAHNASEAPLACGQRCRVAAVDGLVLHLRAA